MMDIFKIFMDVMFLIRIVLIQSLQRANPSLFDKLIITGKLPGYHFFCIFRGKVILFKHLCLSDIILLKHILGIKLNREIRRVLFITIYMPDVRNLNHALG